MRVAHFYAKTSNLGEAGSAAGIQTVLRSLRSDLEFVEFNAETDRISRWKVGRFNRDFGGLIVGGGGLLYNRPRKASGFNLNVSLEAYRKLKMPKCFFGVGINAEYSNDRRWTMTRETKASIAAFLQSTDLVGLRDNESVSFAHGIGAEHAVLSPCPSMLLLYDLVGSTKTEQMAINLTARVVGVERMGQILETLKRFCARVNLRPVLAVHHPDEERVCMKAADALGIEVFLPVSPENLMEFYKGQRYMVGMRGHSLIFATGAALPMLAISYNVKCDALMSMLGMQDYVVRVEDLADPGILLSKLDKLIENRSTIEERLKQRRAEFRKRILDFAAQYVSLLPGKSGV